MQQTMDVKVKLQLNYTGDISNVTKDYPITDL